MYTRKQFAELLGVCKSELYYYEKRGLFKPDDISSANGYRYYSDESVGAFRQIQRLQRAGFSLNEIQSHMDGSDGLSDAEFYDRRESALSGQLQDLRSLREEKAIQQIKAKRFYRKPTAKKEKDR